MKTIRRKRILGLALVAMIACSSWGFLMHRTISQLSVYQLPVEMQPFFHQNMDYVVRFSIRPDERRNSDPSEAAKHYIDLEGFGADAAEKMPLNWDAAVARYSKDTLLKYGYVPYWIVEMKRRLTGAFRNGDKDSILFYAADISHYIEDAHVPLHTTINHDGQLTNQKGMHALWESVVPELFIEKFDLQGKKSAVYLKNPEEAAWKAVRHAHSLVATAFKLEKKLSREFTDSTKYRYQKRNGRDVRYYSTAFAQAYAKKIKSAVNDQAIRAANLVADFWYTAWVDAGRPDLDRMTMRRWETALTDRISSEVKAYRSNELMKNGWLLSKKEAVNDPASSN